MFTVICDNCGADVHEGTEYAGFNDKGFTEDIATDAGWVKQDDCHYCPECFSFDYDDALFIDPKRKDLFKERETP